MEFFILIFLIASIIIVVINSSYSNKRKKEIEYIESLIRPHIHTLSLRRRQLSYRDHYGTLKLDSWRKEQIKFFVHKVAPAFGGEFRMKYHNRREVIDIIDREISAHDTINPPPSSDDFDTNDPRAYEEAVARELRSMGWKANTTAATGDQGVDVVAIKNDVKIVIQCKCYSSPVGNKAVQEAYSAMKYESAKFGAVVTNNEFTKSARQLAESTGILLIHHSELDKLLRLNDNF